MSLFTASLNSGSNGNAYYIGNNSDAVLVDAGLSCRETEKRLRELDLRPEMLKAIFISHEHTDHIKGLPVLSDRYNLPVYVTAATAKYIGPVRPDLIRYFSDGDTIDVGTVSVHAFSKKHDAADPHSFVVSSAGVQVGVFTDIGDVCGNLIHYFRQCHATYLEANYDEYMLENGRYPFHLKNRIRGGEGHLSNRQALELFLTHRPACLSHLFLSHLSEQNNDPDKALELFSAYRKEIHISVASRYQAGKLFHIQTNKPLQLATRPAFRASQMSLF